MTPNDVSLIYDSKCFMKLFANFMLLKTMRDSTTNYAMMLSAIVKNVTESYSFKNFDTFYTDYPITTGRLL